MNTSKWKSIVVVISDPYRGKQLALSKAAAIAARSGARLTLFNSFMWPAPTAHPVISAPETIRISIADREKRLKKLAARLRNHGLSTAVVVRWDFPTHEAIVRYVLKNKPDVVIAESSQHGKLARWFLANTDWELIRSCPCPVWFTRSAALPKRLNLAVAVDPRHTHAKPSELDDRLLTTARQMTKQLSARVSVLHAYDLPMTIVPTPTQSVLTPASAEELLRAKNRTEQLVARLATKYSIPKSDRHVEVGEATLVLRELSKELKTDVLLMGAVSRGRAQQPFIGNTAEKVIDHVTCDVLVVKPANFRTPVRRNTPQLPRNRNLP